MPSTDPLSDASSVAGSPAQSSPRRRPRLALAGALVGSALPLVGSALPLVGSALPLVGSALPLVGSALPLVGSALPLVGSALPLVGSALLFASTAQAAPIPGDGQCPLEWRGKKYEVEALPGDLNESARNTFLGWSAWADANDYRLTLTDDQRLLLVQSSRRKPAEALKAIAKVAEIVDTLLPAPPREEDSTLHVESGADAPPPPAPDPTGAWQWEWEDDGGPLETATAVILQLRNEADQRAALAKLRLDFPYLTEWSHSAAEQVGFSLERPLCAAWLESADGQQEWNPEHELSNRTTQLLVLRRFGQLPFWLLQGLAWHVEWELHGEIYCYPYRAEFVWATEHGAWPSVLKQEFDDRKDRPFQIAEVADWRRGVFVNESAAKAFGVVRFLAQHRAPVLPGFLEDLRLHRDREGRQDHGDGSWSRIPGYEVPAADQQRLLEERAGADVRQEISEFFRRGKSYRAPKK
jgi:hypothetical protein